ncbi:MAG TPA: Ig-like domain-containing protein [Pseudomonadota bacterium]|nr:Ig-like domain-containing protein [Pseudomonadota bacterium]
MRADSPTRRPSSPNLLAALVLLALASLGAGCDKKLSGIELRAAPQLVKGTTAQLRAFGSYTDGSRQDLTSAATWTSDRPGVVAVSDQGNRKGLVVALGTGRCQITVRAGEQQAAAVIDVSEPLVTALAITPVTPMIASGTSAALRATATLSDGTTRDVTAQASWSSLSSAIATFQEGSERRGQVTAVAPGTAVLTAMLAGVAGAVSLRVKDAALTALVISPVSPTLASGTRQQLVATGMFSDRTTQDLSSLVSWSSSDDAVVAVANTGARGLCSAGLKGKATVTARFAGISGATTLTVTDATLVAIGVTPTGIELARGTRQQFVATGTYSDGTTQDLTTAVSWESSNRETASVATLPGSEGLAMALVRGSSLINATLDGKSGAARLVVADAELVDIAVAPDTAAIAQGTTQQFVATGTYSDGSSQDLTRDVTWSASDSLVLAISNAGDSHGLATGLKRGAVTIRATFGAISGSAAFAVSDATLQSLTVSPAVASLAAGTTMQLTATGTYSDGSVQDLTAAVGWAAEDGAVAQLSNVAGSQGLFTALGKGETMVTAVSAGVTGTATLSVTSATLVRLTISPRAATLALGSARQFVALGTFSDGSAQDLTSAATWSSSALAVATVSNAAGSRGLLSSAAIGTALILASLGGKGDSTTLMVN